jgi:hypothetical protein
MCEFNYPNAIPLGRKESFCYKGADGHLVHDSQSFLKGETFEIGDVIGMSMDIASPHKYPLK